MGDSNTKENATKTTDSLDEDNKIPTFTSALITAIVVLIFYLILNPLFGDPLGLIFMIPISYSLHALSRKITTKKESVAH